jgi:rod shape-determining protein MreC
MKQKDRSFSWTRTLYLLVALVLVSLALILLSQGRNLQPVESVANTIFTPIQHAASSVTSTVGDWITAVVNAKQLQEKNKQLQEAVDALTAENAQDQAKIKESDQLRAMLKFQADRPEIQAVLANNIGGDPNALSEILTIDKGTSEGIKVGMPVVSPGGILVGQVSATKPDRSTVLLITDIQSVIPVATQRTQTPGVLEGRWQQGGNMMMTHIPRDADVQKNDMLLTSGLGGTFPKGLICAQVFEVRQNDVQMEKQAVAVPFVDLNALSNVLVITNGTSK